MGQLSARLRLGQIAAAQRLYDRLPVWRLAERSLDELARRFPTFDDVACVAQVTTLNALYATMIYAVMRMAEHVRGVMAECGAAPKGADFVERLANLPTIGEGGARRGRHVSFASKFAHVVIDANRFPLIDPYALAALAKHLGKANVLRDTAHSYVAYAATSKNLDGLQVSMAQ